MLVSLDEASEATGVPPHAIVKMAFTKRIGRQQKKLKNGIPKVFFFSEDYDRMRDYWFDQPQPDDPTPEEIRRRCKTALAMRKTSEQRAIERQRRQVLRLFDRFTTLTADDVATELRQDRDQCRARLDELEAVGLLDHAGELHTRYFVPDSVIAPTGLESAESILRRFRDRAEQATARPVRQSIAA